MKFQKGNIPYNKGLKRGSVSPDTEFKKGVHASNFKGYGTPKVSTRGEVYTTIKDKIPKIDTRTGKIYFTRKRISYARYLWKKHNGKIPKGMIVYNKLEDPHNVHIENLELITRSELLELNRRKKDED